MKQNMGMVDRIARVVVAIVFAALYFLNVVEGTVGMVLLGLGGVFILTSVISFCPLYLPLKISTKKDE
ncbi:MAG: DUF2892 domain-containing protein [Leptospiraceae bacterium]|nr:DUF2892 domain-containing protein [Leptospiraceae bacterium]MCP5512460.1 DUF2892 domain-containing protein [Leptospiraceae bacterium]